MYNLTEHWLKNRCKERKRSPTTWLNGRGSHFRDFMNVTRGRNGSTLTASKEAFEDYCDYLDNAPTKRSCMMYEEGALSAIEQVLNIGLVRQFNTGKYIIDGYDKLNNIAYEIDEPHHFASKYKIEIDRKREEEIKAELGCSFVRIKITDKLSLPAALRIGKQQQSSS